MRGPELKLRPLSRRTKVACIGSSYTQHGVDFSNASQRISVTERNYLEWWNIFSRHSLNMDVFIDPTDPLLRGFRGSNFAVSGETSTEIKSRIENVIKVAPDICILQSGSNNITDPVTVLADVKETVYRLYQAGIITVWMSVNLRTALSWTDATCQRALRVNAEMRTWLRETGYGIFVETNKYLCDPNDPAGRPYSAALDTDGIHYNSWSAFQIGRVLKEVLDGSYPLAAGASVVSNGDLKTEYNQFGNVWSNPFISTNAAIGSNSGSVGTGVTAGTGTASTSVGRDRTVDRASGTATGVANVESRGPGLGNWQTLTVTPSGAGDSLFYIRNNPSDIVHGISEGTWVKVGGMVDVSTFGSDPLYSGFRSITLYVDFRDATSGKGNAIEMDDYGSFNLPNIAWNGIYETPPFRIPAGCDRIRPRFEIRVDDTKSGTGTVKVGSLYIRPIENPSAMWKA